MIPANFISELINHLWQSTAFAAAIWLLTFALRKNQAHVRYRLWLIASVKFLAPFSFLLAIGSHLRWTAAPMSGPDVSLKVAQIAKPFLAFQLSTSTLPAVQSATSTPESIVPVLLLVVWLCGFLTVVAAWARRWLRIRTTVRAASKMPVEADLPVVWSASTLEPGVFGIFQPVLLLPAGIAERLSPEHLRAIIAHELCHVRRRDNLAAAIHMVVEAIFWFHPLVWWIGSRLVDERERACDEEVLRLDSEPEIYAESILKTCEFCVESPLACVSGITGSGLKQRILRIMMRPVSDRLNFRRKLLLAGFGISALVVPIMFGAIGAMHGEAKSTFKGTAPRSFDVASIRPSEIWKLGGEGSSRSRFEYSPNGIRLLNVDVSECIQWAYGVPFYQLSAPKSLDKGRYDVLAKADAPVSVADLRLMMQSLLASRFKVVLHRETRTVPVYELIVAEGGPKLLPTKLDVGSPVHSNESLPRVEDGDFVFQNTSLTEFAEKLSQLRGVDRPVVDRTGIPGAFDITLKSAASALLDAEGPSLFTLVKEQLGLKVVSTKAPMEILVIDHAQKPSEN